MRNLNIVLATSLVLVSCTSLREDFMSCVTDEHTKLLLPTLEASADSNARDAGLKITKTTLAERTCNKRVYERSGHRILLFNNPDDSSVMTKGTLSAPHKKIRHARCLQEARTTLLGFKRASYLNVLDKHRTRWEWLWNDMDIGPVKWLYCDAASPREWYESLNTLVHELNHENREHDCLFDPHKKEQMCFDIPSSLPKAGIAKLSAFPTKNKEQLKGLEGAQELYLGRIEQDCLQIFDELNSYILTQQLYTDVVMSGRVKNIRSVSYLPLFMVYTVRYLEETRKKDPSRYAKYLGKGTPNRQHVEKLLRQGEMAYAEFVRALTFKKMKPLDHEAGLWNIYRETKQRLAYADSSS